MLIWDELNQLSFALLLSIPVFSSYFVIGIEKKYSGSDE